MRTLCCKFNLPTHLLTHPQQQYFRSIPPPKAPKKLTPYIQCRFRHRRQHVPAVPLRSGLPPILELHVQRDGDPVGGDAPGVRGGRARPHPRHLLPVRRQDPGEEQVRADDARQHARRRRGGLRRARLPVQQRSREGLRGREQRAEDRERPGAGLIFLLKIYPNLTYLSIYGQEIRLSV